jgi:hypothetical protein
MSTSIRAPRHARGALLGFDLASPLPRVVVFQYNPETVTRTLKTRGGSSEGGPAEPMRLLGPPEETIKLELELDATDALEAGGGVAETVGLHPQLAALEMLTYPGSALVIANTVALAAGVIEVLPPMGPFTLLVFGASRILPVRVQELEIVEQQHDTALNPIRARVTTTLKVLSYADLSITNPMHYVFIAHQVAKEVFAGMATVDDISAVVGGDVRLF